jgi:hypothetical protein
VEQAPGALAEMAGRTCGASPTPAAPPGQQVAELEQRAIEAALAATGGNKAGGRQTAGHLARHAV